MQRNARCQSFLNTNGEQRKKQGKFLGQPLSPNYAPSRFYTFIPVCIYISMAKRREALVILWRDAVSFPSWFHVVHRGIYRFIIDEAITRDSPPPLRSVAVRIFIGNKTARFPLAHSCDTFHGARRGARGRESYGKKEARRDASVKARLAPVINYQPVHAPVVFFNFSPYSVPSSNDLFLLHRSIRNFTHATTRDLLNQRVGFVFVASLCKKRFLIVIEIRNSYLDLLVDGTKKKKKGKRIFFERLRKWYILHRYIISNLLSTRLQPDK